MRLAIALLALLAVQDQKKDLKPVNENMAKLKTYHFTLKVEFAGETKLSMEGEMLGVDALHIRTDKAEVARKGDRKLVKSNDEWKEPPKAKREKDADDVTMPHEWAKKMSDGCGLVKREKSDKIGATTVDIYVGLPGVEDAKKAAEGGGFPFISSLVDWTKAKNAIQFSVGRDDLYYRVEQKFEAGAKSGAIVIEFSEFNKAKCRLPDDVKKKLGIE